MVTLAISSQKGGVGKTTLSVNLAYSLAKRGWKTLLMDVDPQGSVGLSLSEKARTCPGFYDAAKSGSDVSAMILPTRLPELKVLTAGKAPGFFEVQPEGTNGREALQKVLDAVEEDDFDLVVIDTPAGLSDYAGDSLRCADYVLIPQQAEPLGIRSIPQILQAIQELRRSGCEIKVAGIVLTMVQSDQAESVEVARELRKLIPAQLLLESMVPRDPVFLKASGVGVPLGLLYKKPPASALVFDQMAAELEQKMHLEHIEDDAEDFTRLMD